MCDPAKGARFHEKRAGYLINGIFRCHPLTLSDFLLRKCKILTETDISRMVYAFLGNESESSRVQKGDTV